MHKVVSIYRHNPPSPLSRFVPSTRPLCGIYRRGKGGSSFSMHAVSSMLVHLPLVPAWLCLRCCLKWSARKNFLLELHSRNLCTSCKCRRRASQSCSVAWRVRPAEPLRLNSSPQKPHTSASPGRFVLSWKAWSYPCSSRAEQDQLCRLTWRLFWCRSASFLFLKRLPQKEHSYCFSASCALGKK